MTITIESPILEFFFYRMSALITGDQQPYYILFEVEKKYLQYLCIERSDAFLVSLFPHFMAIKTNDGCPLTINMKTPLSEKLFYQLSHYYIPTLAKFTTMYNNIILECEIDSAKIMMNSAIGTGVSGGVDSFYTLLSHQNNNSRAVTHGVYCNTGMFGGVNGSGELFLQNEAKKICDEMKINFVVIRSNICKDVYKILHAAIISPMFMSFSLALQKLFSTYYFSSETSFAQFSLYQHNSERYDLLNVHCFSTENIQFYSSGSETNRIGKLSYISNFPIIHNMLNVCPANSVKDKQKYRNCSRCSKCTYTMIQLDVLDKLDLFKNIFDVNAFRKFPSYYYGYFLYKDNKDIFKKETFEEMRNRNKKLYFKFYIAGFLKIIKNKFKRLNPLAEVYRP